MIIKGYKKISYSELVDVLIEYKKLSKKDKVKIASSIGLKCTQTITGAFYPYYQKVSDILLSKLMKFLEIDGFIAWYEGERCYFLKKDI